MLSLIAMDFFQKSPVLLFPVAALGVFMLVFFGVTLRTVLTDKAKYDHLAALPLNDEQARPEVEEAGRE